MPASLQNCAGYEKEIHQERYNSVHGLRMREEYMIAFLLNPSSVCMCTDNCKLSHASCDPAGVEQENFIGCNAVLGMELLEGKLKKGLPSQPGLTCVKYEEEN
jgi:hypothetical protein